MKYQGSRLKFRGLIVTELAKGTKIPHSDGKLIIFHGGKNAENVEKLWYIQKELSVSHENFCIFGVRKFVKLKKKRDILECKEKLQKK